MNNLKDLSPNTLDILNNNNSDDSTEITSSEFSSDYGTENYCKICDPKCKYNNCICNDKWKYYDEILQNIKNTKSNVLLESLRISTITLCFNLNSTIDVQKLAEKYPCKNNGKFYNCYIFNWHTKYQKKTIVSIKIFPNGKIQVAGLCNIKACAYIIRKVSNKCSCFADKIIISDAKIAMINSDFKLSNSLNLTKFCDILSNYSIQQNGNFLSVIYQPIKYPAINCKFICDNYLEEYCKHIDKYSHKKKFNYKLSILIFRSGSIIITGGNNLEDYLYTYKYLLDLINKNFKNLHIYINNDK
tara:strand:- start:454 stop:1356 length:903 start_codon:yes stop_codon:yes gene_type:complete